MTTVREKVTFAGADGVSQLAARLDRPRGPVRAYALFAHCFTCSKNVFAAERIAEGLVKNGIAVLRFDFTGLGASEGDFANTDFSSNVGDLVAAARWLELQHQAPAILVGHSLGGAAVLAAAGEIPAARAVATVNAPAEPGHVRRLFKHKERDIARDGVADVEIAGRTFRVGQRFLDDIEETRLKDKIAHLRRALLIFHGPRDTVVGIDNATKIFTAAKHPKSFVSLDDADHLLSRRADAVYVADVIAAWAMRYLDPLPEEPMVEVAPEGAVSVTEAGSGRFTQIISVGGRHTLLADEPATYGGADMGPSPYDFLLAGLGACTTMTIRMYAERKGIPLDRARVTLRHAKVHATDCAECETKDGKVDRIERAVELTGALDAETRAKLLEIADKCPVHRTLHSEIWIDTREVPPGEKA